MLLLQRIGWAALCLAAAPAGGAFAARLQLPPVVVPPNQALHVGKPIFAELVTPDLAAAERFYGGLFGWQFQMVPGLKSPYAAAVLNGATVAGLVEKPLTPAEHKPAAWLVFFAVQDAAAVSSTAQAQGARVLLPAHEVPGRGREALLADPQGGVFGVLASSSGNPPDVLPETGNFIWVSLLAPDASRDAEFYKALFGYQVFGAPPDGDGRHMLMASENYARASINALPPGLSGAQGQWVSYVRVDDAVKAAGVAVLLGGRLLVPPHPDRHGGTIAVVADPAGAPVGLFDWPTDGLKAVTP